MMNEYKPKQPKGAAMNNGNQSPTPPSIAFFGVSLLEDGKLSTVAAGEFDAGYADHIARQLVLLASVIRTTARQRLSKEFGRLPTVQQSPG
jgi:hypothetical protein